jgi:CHAD domain-containing protein
MPARTPAPPKVAVAAGAAAAGAAAAGAAAAVRRKRTRPSRAYRLKEGQPLPESLARIAAGRIEHAVEELRGKTDDGPEEAVHEARKDMKKLRALLRLVRDEIGDETYRVENATFRDAARRLSSVRDADVMLATLDSLDDQGDVGVALRSAIEEHRASLETGGGGRDDAARDVIDRLEDARKRLDEWPLEHDGFEAVEQGLRRVYKRGRRELGAAEGDPTSEALHEWRKRTKDLWYHLQILRPSWSSVLKPLSDEAHLLSEQLGNDHDLAVLQGFAHERLKGLDLEPFDQAVEGRRAELQAEALALGRRLYAEPAAAFTRRMRRYYGAWQLDAAD